MIKYFLNKFYPLRLLGLLGGLFAFVLILNLKIDAAQPLIGRTLAVAVLMAVWWITEAVPIAATALLPIVLFPLLGISDGKTVSSAYANHIIFLFIGGFIMALAMERHNLHKRIALRVLMWTGPGYNRLLLGFMFSTAFLSMWMSNTATVMMMLPIANSIILKFEDDEGKENVKRISIGLMLGIAYSASAGGIATLIGTPPNPAFTKIFAIMFPAAPEISFSQWMLFGFPVSIFMLFFSWLLISRMYRPKNKMKANVSVFRTQYKELGKMRFEELVVLVAFVLLAVLWISRSGFDFGTVVIPGWASVFGNPKYINDGTVAIGMALILFLIPSNFKKGDRILELNVLNKLPWGIIILFGGGFALAGGFVDSGLSLWMGEKLKAIGQLDPIVIIFIIALFMSFLTEITSNTATTQILLPVLAGLAISIKINPYLLMLPATVAASLAFMLPVATPPNAIVFGSGRLKIADMVKTGFWLNMIGVFITTLVSYYWGQYVFNIDVGSLPVWMNM